jgi:exopolysaccharide/PEP-CTERM locus tyrosine autokinase
MSLIQDALERAKAERSDEFSTADSHDRTGSSDRARAPELAAPTRFRSARQHVEIDWQAMRDSGLLVPEDNEELIARQIRDIKRPLIAHAFGKRATLVPNGNLIMVTSALAGEGKTFISFNLARSMAEERDHTVLLVDADVAKPHTSNLLGLQGAPGLLDLLENPNEHVESAIFDTDTHGLTVLPAGKPRAQSTELLASARMEKLTRQLTAADPNRIVVFDSPPLIQTSESKVLADFVGQIVFVVCAAQTPKGAVAEAMMSLGEGKCVNLILNKSASAASVSRYGHSGYGGYGFDYRDKGKRADGAAASNERAPVPK